MIVLSLLTEPVEVPLPELGPGVSVTLRRLTSPQLAQAQARAQNAVRDLAAGRAQAQAYGLEGVNLVSPAEMFQAGHLIGAVEVALAAVISWRGILLEDKSPAPVSRETLSVLLKAEAIDRAFRREITAACRILMATDDPSDPTEGNGSGPSPAGSTATRPGTMADQNTAEAAMRPASPAPGGKPGPRGATARKPSTRRAPPKGRPSGG